MSSSTANNNSDAADELEAFINDKCDYINTLGDINLLPLTPQLPNCYMYTVIYSLSNLSKFINYSVNLCKPQFSYLFPTHAAVEKFNNRELEDDRRKFIIFWLNECFKYLLNLHKQQDHVEDFNRRFLHNFNINDIYSCLREYCPMAEEDASAFLEFLFDNLNEVNKTVTGANSNDDGIETLFKTRINTCYKCKNCSNASKVPDDVWSIWRTSAENVDENENLLDSFFKSQSLKPYNCENCKKKDGEAEILTSISGKLPQCLIIQIERMQFKDNYFYKSDKRIKFDEKVSIQNIEYNLKAIILHLGDGLVEGHYLVAVKKAIKRENTELWYILDGDKYQYGLDISNDGVHKNAILLFYMQN